MTVQPLLRRLKSVVEYIDHDAPICRTQDDDDCASLLRSIHVTTDERLRLTRLTLNSSGRRNNNGCAASAMASMCRSSSAVNISEPRLLLLQPGGSNQGKRVPCMRRSFRRGEQAEAKLMFLEASACVSAEVDTEAPAGGGVSLRLQQHLGGAGVTLRMRKEEEATEVTPPVTPMAAVPFFWEEAPGKPKPREQHTVVASPPRSPLPLPPHFDSIIQFHHPPCSNVVHTPDHPTQMTTNCASRAAAPSCCCSCRRFSLVGTRRHRLRRHNASISSCNGCSGSAASTEECRLISRQNSSRPHRRRTSILRHLFFGGGVELCHASDASGGGGAGNVSCNVPSTPTHNSCRIRQRESDTGASSDSDVGHHLTRTDVDHNCSISIPGFAASSSSSSGQWSSSSGDLADSGTSRSTTGERDGENTAPAVEEGGNGVDAEFSSGVARRRRRLAGLRLVIGLIRRTGKRKADVARRGEADAEEAVTTISSCSRHLLPAAEGGGGGAKMRLVGSADLIRERMLVAARRKQQKSVLILMKEVAAASRHFLSK